ncbi:unnamed protein product [Discosporangium mesarthrocarpum]
MTVKIWERRSTSLNWSTQVASKTRVLGGSPFSHAPLTGNAATRKSRSPSSFEQPLDSETGPFDDTPITSLKICKPEVYLFVTLEACPLTEVSCLSPNNLVLPNSPLVNGANWLVTNVKDGFGRLKMGTSGLWQSYRTCSAIRARVKQGHTPTYPEVAHLQRGKEDRSKVLTALMVWVILPEVFPLLLTVMPAMVPSTFEVPAEVESKYINFSLARARETLKALQDLEQKVYKGKPKQRKEAEEQRRVVLGLLKANSKREAFKELQHCTFIPAPKNKREERVARTSAAQGFPAPMIKCLGKGMGLGLPIAPAFFLRFKIRQYVQDLGPADEALGRQRDESQLGSLSLDELKEACNLRGIDTGAEPSVLRHSLLEWLDLTERAPAESAALGAVFFPDRARVVALGLNFVSSVRDGGRTELAREAINGAW